ncbi:MAG: MAPEG family protein [Pseudomonadota bacterium]
MEFFEPYSHALAAMSGYALLMFVLTYLSVFGRGEDMRTASGAVKRDYANPMYRRGRAHANAVETAGPFLLATCAGILTGAAPFWVNALASTFLVARILMALVHIGTTNQPARSAFWGISIVCVLALAVLGLLAAFT